MMMAARVLKSLVDARHFPTSIATIMEPATNTAVIQIFMGQIP